MTSLFCRAVLTAHVRFLSSCTIGPAWDYLVAVTGEAGRRLVEATAAELLARGRQGVKYPKAFMADRASWCLVVQLLVQHITDITDCAQVTVDLATGHRAGFLGSGPRQWRLPAGIAADVAGNMLVVDQGNCRTEEEQDNWYTKGLM